MPKKLYFCITIPSTFKFGFTVIRKLRDAGYDVTLLSSSEDELAAMANELGVKYIHVPFYRGMNPFKDVAAINQLYKIFRADKPDIVMAATPKASMVAMIAARLAGIKNRIYHIYGLPYETAHGLKKKLLLSIEKLTGACATTIVPIGTSVKESTLAYNLYPLSKISQSGLLTIGGVDVEKFDPALKQTVGKELRRQHALTDNDIVIGFVARFTYDKGFTDLIELWQQIKTRYNNVYLMVAGSMDKRVPLPQETVDNFFNDKRVINLGYRRDIQNVFAAMDIFLFPSYREGFGNVSIEASAMEIPVVTYDVTGCKDAVENGVTGYSVPFKDYDAVMTRLSELIENPELRSTLGEKGRKRVIDNFTLETVADNLYAVIDNLDK